MRILVCGGAGYIGSHTVRELTKAGHIVIVLDNFSRGYLNTLKNINYFEGDIGDSKLVSEIIRKYRIEACMHFAAYSLVGESVSHPDLYYLNNVVKCIELLNVITQEKVKYFIFSSSAAVYGEPSEIPIRENHPTVPTNPYGETKLAIEKSLRWYEEAFGLKYVYLRYFNAAGADLASDIGEDHNPETHLVPLVLKASLNKIHAVSVFGTDYPTRDGTCIRDYVHVTDLAKAHLLALNYICSGMSSDYFNLGNGNGFSVLEIIKTAEEVTGIPLKVNYDVRRPGDPAILVASASKANKILGWKPELSDIRTILESAWKWHKDHPEGFFR